MIALLKWTSVACAGVVAMTVAAVVMLLNGVLTPVATLLAYAAALVLIVPVIFTVAVAPHAMPLWQAEVLFAVALYLWIFLILALGQMVLALRPPPRQPVAMY